MKRQTVKVVLSAVLVCFVVCFIFSNSMKDGEKSNRQSGIVMELLRSIFDPNHTIAEETFHHFVRKSAHFSEFALLGLSLWLLMGSIRGKFGISCPGVMLFSALAVAVTDEFIQSFAGRTSSVTDVLIDFSGALTAFLILLLLCVILRKRTKEKKNAAKECGTE